jgi:hypothetical protein
VSTLNFTERSCLPRIASTIQIFQKKESTLKANRIRCKQTMEQNGTIRKQNGTKYKHQQEQQEQDDDDEHDGVAKSLTVFLGR